MLGHKHGLHRHLEPALPGAGAPVDSSPVHAHVTAGKRDIVRQNPHTPVFVLHRCAAAGARRPGAAGDEHLHKRRRHIVLGLPPPPLPPQLFLAQLPSEQSGYPHPHPLQSSSPFARLHSTRHSVTAQRHSACASLQPSLRPSPVFPLLVCSTARARTRALALTAIACFPACSLSLSLSLSHTHTHRTSTRLPRASSSADGQTRESREGTWQWANHTHPPPPPCPLSEEAGRRAQVESGPEPQPQ